MPNTHARNQDAKPLSPGYLKAYRRYQGLSRIEITERLGIHPCTWGRWEEGKSVPGSWKMLRLALRQLHQDLLRERKE